MAKDKGKASKPEVAERVAEILRIRLDGAAFHDCVAYAAEKGWGVSERQVGRYIEAADDLLAQRMETKRRRMIGLHLARRESLFARCVNAADYRSALAVLADLAKLQGLYASDKDLRELVRLATAQADRLRDLEARIGAHRPAEGETPPAGPAAGPAGGGGTGEARGPTGDLPGGPDAPDG